MKKIKCSILLLLTVIIALSLTACVKETHNVEIHSNGGSIIKEQVITKDVYNQLISMGSDVSELKNEGYVIDFFEEDGENYVKATKEFKFDNLSALERYFEELATSDEGANSEKYFESFDIESKGGKISITGIIGKPDASAAYTSCIINLKFDGKISKHSFGEKLDSNMLKLDMMDLWTNNSGEELVIKAGSSSITIWLILCALIVITLVSVIVLIKKNKKQVIVTKETE